MRNTNTSNCSCRYDDIDIILYSRITKIAYVQVYLNGRDLFIKEKRSKLRHNGCSRAENKKTAIDAWTDLPDVKKNIWINTSKPFPKLGIIVDKYISTFDLFCAAKYHMFIKCQLPEPNLREIRNAWRNLSRDEKEMWNNIKYMSPDDAMDNIKKLNDIKHDDLTTNDEIIMSRIMQKNNIKKINDLNIDDFYIM